MTKNPEPFWREFAAVLAFVLPGLIAITAVLFIVLNVGHPEYMSAATIIAWGATVAGAAVLTLIAASVVLFVPAKGRRNWNSNAVPSDTR